ncbi:MAG: hypothetical protein HYR72_03875 [Deltaproteobacteria bacterium]|nr:hypothetical protein [Deltaproteobacteria bacterium]MBI3388674.1 hypothetical protein [Deltaproteobacteria bacterium]
MMKKPSISFRHFEGSGPLSVYWYPGPYGDAVDARSGAGVGWFAPNGELLGVEFDDVTVEHDHQTLPFANGESVEIEVSRGKVSVRRKRIRNVA